MAGFRFLAVILVVLMVASLALAGCTGGKGGPQPPSSMITMTTRQPATPLPLTTAPPVTATAVTPAIPTPTPAWTPGTISQDGASILIRGDVTGYRSSTGNYIDEIRFTVVKAPRAEPVTFEIPSTQMIFTKAGAPPYGVNYLLLSGDVDGDRILDEGESFLVGIRFTTDASQYVIYAGQRFTLAIKNPPQPQVLVSAGAPPDLPAGPVILATA